MAVITFSDGSSMEVAENGTCFLTEIAVDDSYFVGKLSPVTISRSNQTDTFKQGEFTLIDTFQSEGSATKYLFSISEVVENREDFISYLASKVLTDEEAIAHQDMFADWNPNGVKYEKDTSKVRHNGRLWKCITTHTSQYDWAPSVAVSLWTRMDDPAIEYPEWVQPTGAHDAYAMGAKVSHNGKHWMSTVDANTWEPGVYGWDEVPEESSEEA